MFTNRRPYYGLKMSTTDFFRESVRYLKQSNIQESMMEKPYLIDEYQKMHLSLPDFKFKLKDMSRMRYKPGYEFRPEYGPGSWPRYKLKPGSAPFSGIATGRPDTSGGLAFINFGEADCSWDVINTSYCIKEPIVITMSADYLFHAEFKFVAQIAKDTIGVTLAQLPGTEAFAGDDQDFLLTFPEDAKGSVTICGFASTYTLASQTFETVVAGMPVGVRLIRGALLPTEMRQGTTATLLKSVYGHKGADCGCVEISSNCKEEGCSCENISIGYTTQQMSIDEVQTLTVNNPDPECIYSWSIASGGGSLSSPTGTSVDYTAPSSNANCVNNATITMGVESGTCDTLEIAVNAWIPWDAAYKLNCPTDYGRCIWFGGQKRCVNETIGYRCNGIVKPGCSSFDPAVCTGSSSCVENSECVGCSVGVIDERSSSMRAGGCCPVELL